MIKINLLPQRKPKRQSEPGQRDLLIGVVALALAGAAVFLFVHKPQKDKLDKQRDANASFEDDLNRRNDAIRDLVSKRAAVATAKERSTSIDKLVAARAVPAHMLDELGEILTPGHMPTMTVAVAEKVAKDDTFAFREDWDPKHVWITELVEKEGGFTLRGGAESDGDVTQLAKRMQASAYFEDVAPAGGQKVTDKENGITYYEFTITGKVVY